MKLTTLLQVKKNLTTKGLASSLYSICESVGAFSLYLTKYVHSTTNVACQLSIKYSNRPNNKKE